MTEYTIIIRFFILLSFTRCCLKENREYVFLFLLRLKFYDLQIIKIYHYFNEISWPIGKGKYLKEFGNVNIKNFFLTFHNNAKTVASKKSFYRSFFFFFFFFFFFQFFFKFFLGFFFCFFFFL